MGLLTDVSQEGCPIHRVPAPDSPQAVTGLHAAPDVQLELSQDSSECAALSQ